jgi:hypothetical protein
LAAPIVLVEPSVSPSSGFSNVFHRLIKVFWGLTIALDSMVSHDYSGLGRLLRGAFDSTLFVFFALGKAVQWFGSCREQLLRGILLRCKKPAEVRSNRANNDTSVQEVLLTDNG